MQSAGAVRVVFLTDACEHVLFHEPISEVRRYLVGFYKKYFFGYHEATCEKSENLLFLQLENPTCIFFATLAGSETRFTAVAPGSARSSCRVGKSILPSESKCGWDELTLRGIRHEACRRVLVAS